jgi:predicted amidohydrolase YtcJ
MAGITRETLAPTGGVIDRDANGEPTGILRETAMRLVRERVPPFEDKQISNGIDLAIKLMHSRGVTSATEPGVDLRTFGIYAEKARAGALPMRVTALLSNIGGRPDALKEMLAAFEQPAGVDPRVLRAIGVKLGADGIPRFRTAWMHKPYLDGSNGQMTVAGSTREEQIANLHRMIQMCADAGFQVGTHSCGDAATDAVVDGYVKTIQKAGGKSELRHAVHHCNFASAQTLKTMAQYGIGANLNGEILHLQGRVLEPIIGKELTDYQWPYRSAIDAGVQVTSGSDAPVVADNHWLRGVTAAVLRQGMDGSQAGEAERITVPEALATYTRTGAWQDRAETWKGTLEPGMIADVCIVNGDLARDDPRNFLKMEVTTTIVGGKVVYERSNTAQTEAVNRIFASVDSACRHGALCCCKLAEELSA